jgi:hypothetical protein
MHSAWLDLTKNLIRKLAAAVARLTAADLFNHLVGARKQRWRDL